MNLDYNFFKVDDGHSIAYKKWTEAPKPSGVIILVHGMAEHIERYDNFASYLNNRGLLVYGLDHRGHGKTAGKKGLFTYGKEYNRAVYDQVEFFNFVKNENPDLPISYFAHSMGSYIIRCLLSTNNLPIKNVILSGTGYEPAVKRVVAICLARVISKLKGPGETAYFIDRMVNKPFSDSIKDPNTVFDWLSRDQVEVAKYINDSNCGFKCCNKFFLDFFKIIAFTCSNKQIDKIDKNLPILLYSGSNDPVGGKNSKGVKKLFEIYSSMGLNVKLSFNPDGRHESLNEINRLEIYPELSDFLLN